MPEEVDFLLMFNFQLMNGTDLQNLCCNTKTYHAILTQKIKQEFHWKKFYQAHNYQCIFEKKGKKKKNMHVCVDVGFNATKNEEDRNNECTLNKCKRRIDKRIIINLNECIPVGWQYLIFDASLFTTITTIKCYMHRTVQPPFICHFSARFLKWKGSLYLLYVTM